MTAIKTAYTLMLQFSVRDALPLTNMSNLNIRKAQHLRHNLFPYDIIPLKIWIMTSEFKSYIYIKKCYLHSVCIVIG